MKGRPKQIILTTKENIKAFEDLIIKEAIKENPEVKEFIKYSQNAK